MQKNKETPIHDHESIVTEILLESLKFKRMDTRLQNIRAAHAGTCTWLFEQPKYKLWRDRTNITEHHGFLWIRGKPGCGKSTIMKALLARSKKVRPHEITLRYFFNAQALDRLEKSSLGMYRSLVHQLLTAIPELQEDFAKHLLRKVRSGKVDEWTIIELQDFIFSTIESLQGQSFSLLIDALDEGEEDNIRDMISFLEELGDASMFNAASVNTCLSSRHYPHVSIRSHLSLIVENQQGHDQDIVKYVRDKLIGDKGPKHETLVADICLKASGVFLWVVLVVPILNRLYDEGHESASRQRLLAMPTALDGLFPEIFRRNPDTRDRSVLLLQWVVFSFRPLSAIELYLAFEYGIVSPDELDYELPSSERLNKYILSCSMGLVEFLKSQPPTALFIHEAIKDFLLGNTGLSTLQPELRADPIGLSHDRLRRCCTQFLGKNERPNFDTIFKSAKQSEVNEEIAMARNQFPFLEYAASHVFKHANVAEGRGVSQKQFLKSFTSSSEELQRWAGCKNLFQRNPARRYTSEINLASILSDYGLSYLIKAEIELRKHGEVSFERNSTDVNKSLEIREDGEAASESGLNDEVMSVVSYDSEGEVASESGLSEEITSVEGKALSEGEAPSERETASCGGALSESGSSDEVMSVVSYGSIFSYATSLDSHSSLGVVIYDAINSIIDAFVQDSELESLYEEARVKINYQRLIRNHERFLRMLYSDIGPYFTMGKEREAIKLLRSPRQRVAMTRKICERYGPHPKHGNAMSKKTPDLFDKSSWQMEPIPPPNDETQSTDSGGGDESIHDDENNDMNSWSQAEMRRLIDTLTTGEPFQRFKNNFRRFIHPPKSLEEAITTGDSRPVQNFLNKLLKQGPHSEKTWLRDFCDTGYTPNQVANLLVGNLDEAPWKYVRQRDPDALYTLRQQQLHLLKHKQDRGNEAANLLQSVENAMESSTSDNYLSKSDSETDSRSSNASHAMPESIQNPGRLANVHGASMMSSFQGPCKYFQGLQEVENTIYKNSVLAKQRPKAEEGHNVYFSFPDLTHLEDSQLRQSLNEVTLSQSLPFPRQANPDLSVSVKCLLAKEFVPQLIECRNMIFAVYANLIRLRNASFLIDRFCIFVAEGLHNSLFRSNVANLVPLSLADVAALTFGMKGVLESIVDRFSAGFGHVWVDWLKVQFQSISHICDDILSKAGLTPAGEKVGWKGEIRLRHVLDEIDY